MNLEAGREIVATIDQLRREYAPHAGVSVPWATVSAQMDEHLAAFRDLAVVRAFAEDCRRASRHEVDFGASRDALRESGEPLALGWFKAAYNPELTLECAYFELLRVEPFIETRYPGSYAAPILNRCSTRGFDFPLCVALFPENFVSARPVSPEDRAYYFIDRFVMRFQRVTWPALREMTAATYFPHLSAADPDVIRKACTAWVYLHEYFHRTGNMPLPAYLRTKSTMWGAALEETRVDLLSIAALWDLAAEGYEVARTYAELIVAERAFRYAVQADPATNYDARGGQFLLGYLMARGVFEECDGRLHLRVPFDGLVDECRALSQQIAHCELEAREGPPDCDKRVALMQSVAGPAGPLDLLPLYARARARLGEACLQIEYGTGAAGG